MGNIPYPDMIREKSISVPFVSPVGPFLQVKFVKFVAILLFRSLFLCPFVVFFCSVGCEPSCC